VRVFFRSARPQAAASAAAARTALSPAGRWAAVRDVEGALLLWDLRGEPRAVATLPAEKDTSGHELWALSFTPGSRVLLDARPAGGARRIAVDAPDQPLPDLDTGGPARELLADGARALALHERGAALLDLSDGSLVGQLAGLTAPVRDASFGPDGERLLTIDADGAARLWSTRDGKPLKTLRRPGAPIRRARGAWSPDGEAVLLAGPDRVAQLVAVGGAARTLRGHTDEVYAVGFTSDGAPLTLAADDTLRRWDGAGGSVRVDLLQHGEAVGGARLLPGGDLLLGTPYGGALWLWSAHERGAPMALLGHERSVTAARVDATGDRLLTAAYGDPAPRLWQWGDDPQALRGHEGLIERLAWSPDGTRLLSAAIDGTARVWTPGGAAQVLRRHREDSSIAAAWRPDGRLVATAGSDGVARLWRVDGEEPAVVASLIGPVARDSALLVVPLGPGGKPARESAASEPADSAPALRDVAWSPAGDRLALAGEDGVVHLWSVGPGGAATDYIKMSIGAWPIDLVRFGPRGDLLACAGEDRDARLVPLADGRAGQPIAVGGHAGPVRALAFAAGSRRFATAGDDGVARVFALDPTPTPLRELAGHARGLWSIELTADGKRALTAGADGTARIWDVDDPSAPPTVLLGHGQAVLSASFSPDTATVLTTSADGAARLWRRNPDARDMNTWTSVALPHAGTSGPGELDRNVWAGVWRPDGALVATAAADGVVRLFPVELLPLVAEACARAGRNLSREVSRQVFGDREPVATCPQWPAP
jgi:WD40 repeat protein